MNVASIHLDDAYAKPTIGGRSRLGGPNTSTFVVRGDGAEPRPRMGHGRHGYLRDASERPAAAWVSICESEGRDVLLRLVAGSDVVPFAVWNDYLACTSCATADWLCPC